MLFEVLLRTAYLGKPALNRWHYNSSGVPAAVQLSFALASAFGGIPTVPTGAFPAGTIMSGLAGVQNVAVQYEELSVEALYDVEDFYTIPYGSNQHGLEEGTAMARYEAYSFQTNRVRTDVRRGNKRLVGVTEDRVGVGGAIESDFTAFVNNLAGSFTDTLVYDDEGTDLNFQPCVLSFVEYTTPEGNPAYKKYPTLVEQLEHTALGVTWAAKQKTTTQNSRK